MKKVLLLLISIFILPRMVLAKEYENTDYFLKIDIPDNYYVVTVDNYLDDEAFDVFIKFYEYDESVTKSDYQAYIEYYFEQYNMQMMAYNPDSKIVFTFQPIKINSEAEDFSYEQLKELENDFFDEFEEQQGVTVLDSDTVEINDMAFFKLKYKDEEASNIHYYLMHNGYGYNFIFGSYGNLPEEEVEAFMNNIQITDFNFDNNNETNSNFFAILIIIVAVIVSLFVSLSLKKKKCKMCGRELPNGVKFCSNCGTTVK